MRITGLATGLDMDQVIKESMRPYRIKIDQKAQQKEILEIKQKLYREVIKESRELYNKYFDIVNSDSLLLSKNWATTKFTSSNDNVTVTGGGDAKVDNYTITGKIAKASKVSIPSTSIENDEIIINGQKFTLSGDTEKEKAANLTNELKKAGINVKATYTNFAGDGTANADGYILESTILGKDSIFTVGGTVDASTLVENNSQDYAPPTAAKITGFKVSEGGQDAEIIFTNSKGGVYTHRGTTNNVTLDGVNFKFNGDIPEGEEIKINGKVDVSETKDKLVKFINDYNALIEKLNKLTTEKRDRSFMPLTAEQKKEMSEDEIKLWNERVERGQLSRDSDLTRIANSLKNAMRNIVEGASVNLEKIGIVPVKDYQGTKNGTFTIDENLLTKALEDNAEEVMNLFIKSAPKDESLSSTDKYLKTGVLYRLKDVLYNETITSTSNFLKKVGYEGTVTAYNNTLTKSIEEYERKMKDMEIDFARREQALYSKYATLESMMNKYNAQQSYLMQQLGMV